MGETDKKKDSKEDKKDDKKDAGGDKGWVKTFCCRIAPERHLVDILKSVRIGVILRKYKNFQNLT